MAPSALGFVPTTRCHPTGEASPAAVGFVVIKESLLWAIASGQTELLPVRATLSIPQTGCCWDMASGIGAQDLEPDSVLSSWSLGGTSGYACRQRCHLQGGIKDQMLWPS